MSPNTQQTNSPVARGPRRQRSPSKRSKSPNVSIVQRFLICCAALIWVRTDQRERDPVTDELVPKEVNKKASPSSDMSQTDLVRTYFNNIDRTVISQSKWGHRFARPDFRSINVYLFPFIRFNPNISRGQILHVAYRIWEYLVRAGKAGEIRLHGVDAKDNVQLGALRGWWEETTSVKPKGYDAWYPTWTADSELPVHYFDIMKTVMELPWPVCISVHKTGLRILANMAPEDAPPVEHTNHTSTAAKPRVQSRLATTQTTTGPLHRSGSPSTVGPVAGLQQGTQEVSERPSNAFTAPVAQDPLPMGDDLLRAFGLWEATTVAELPSSDTESEEHDLAHLETPGEWAIPLQPMSIETLPLAPETLESQYDESRYWLTQTVDYPIQSSDFDRDLARVLSQISSEAETTSSGSSQGNGEGQTIDPRLLVLNEQTVTDAAKKETGIVEDPPARGPMFHDPEPPRPEVILFQDMINTEMFDE